MTRTGVRGVGAALLLAALSFRTPAMAEQTAARRDVLIDLPYLTQTEQLCGGAALAMVLRYWGTRDVLPEDFAPLVDRSEAGIRTTTLTKAVTDRGWQTLPFSGAPETAPDWIRAQVALGRPVLALIEDRPRVYHYVVIAGATPTEIVLHDPARQPYRVLPRSEFERHWSSAGHWLLVILPANVNPAQTSAVRAATATETGAMATGPCSTLVADSVALARAGDQAEAERGLLAAIALCPASSAALGELAGLRFLQKRYGDSAGLAERALVIAPEDAHARQTLATARFLQGDARGSLAAWNRLGQPRVDVVKVEGADRTRHPVIVGITGLRGRQLLTPEGLLHAERRLAELPVAAVAGLRFDPIDGGSTTVTAVVSERPVLPPGPLGWAMVGIGAAFRREIVVGVAGPTGGGEALNLGYRYGKNRPRVRGEFLTPVPGSFPGIIGIDAMWDRQTYMSIGSGSGPFREERRRVGGRVSDWATGWLRWQVGGAVEHVESRHFVTIETRLHTRWFDDRLAAKLSWDRWLPTSGASGFNNGEAVVSWRTTRRPDLASLLIRGGMANAGTGAPLALWPVASSSQVRGTTLRAHTLYDEGVIIANMLGRRLAFMTTELRKPLYFSPYGSLSVAGFIDSARAWQRLSIDGLSRLETDIGAGIRIDSPTTGGQLRLDVAYGVQNKHTELSAGYVIPFGQ